MIRIEGSAQQAEAIEEKIKKGTVYLAIPFSAFKCYDGGELDNEQAKGVKSRCFTRDYEIIGAADKIKRVSDDGQRRLRDVLLWLTQRPIDIKFSYDYRVDKCEISISYESWQRLVRLIPSIKNSVRIIEPNRCEIIEVTQS